MNSKDKHALYTASIMAVQLACCYVGGMVIRSAVTYAYKRHGRS